jgi:hypothetical protein
MKKAVLSLLLVACPGCLIAQKLAVQIINQQDNETNYTYVVPEHYSQSTSTYGSTTTTSGYGTPAHQVSYHVCGATLSLLLPDGRIAVVNCESKFAERMAGPAGNHRDCRRPIVDHLNVDFHGDKAKLEWVVSIDGKKTQSETYKILGVLDRQPAN